MYSHIRFEALYRGDLITDTFTLDGEYTEKEMLAKLRATFKRNDADVSVLAYEQSEFSNVPAWEDDYVIGKGA
jgi:hypothetical protein